MYNDLIALEKLQYVMTLKQSKALKNGFLKNYVSTEDRKGMSSNAVKWDVIFSFYISIILGKYEYPT